MSPERTEAVVQKLGKRKQQVDSAEKGKPKSALAKVALLRRVAAFCKLQGSVFRDHFFCGALLVREVTVRVCVMFADL